MKNVFQFLLVLIFIVAHQSCDILEPVLNGEQVTGTGTVYLWIASDADSYVVCNKAGTGPCQSFDVDYSGSNTLVVAHNAFSVKRTYVNFPMPVFPEGTNVEEAYFELYHSGKNEDGKTDDIMIDVARVMSAWSASNVRYENQPVPTGPYGEFQIRLRSQDWSGSSNIFHAMNEAIAPGSNFEGFAAFISNYEPGYEKGFYSGNHDSFTLGDLGLAPRLLMKITLPDGNTTNDIDFSAANVHPDNAGSRRFGYFIRTGGNWPAEWDIAASK